MLTRREQLLIRPWQQRRYNNHRRKVQTALPAIDATPPPERGHVCCKLKKLQAEQERCARIEQDNIRLLQRMRGIARTRRVDNRWLAPPPNFLQRVGVYRLRAPPVPEPPPEFGTPPPGRRGRCAACNPALAARAASAPAPEDPSPTPAPTAAPSPPAPRRARTSKPTRTAQLPQVHPTRESCSAVGLPVQRLTLTQGPLCLAVTFPAPSSISLHRGKQQRFLQREFCECTARTT